MNLLLHPDKGVCEEFLNLLGVSAAITRVDGARRFSMIAMNTAGREFFGLSELPGEIPLEVDAVVPFMKRGPGNVESYIERLKTNYQRVVDAREPVLTETEYADGSGAIRWSQNRLVPVFKNGEVDRILVTYSDVTELIEARDLLEKSLAGIMAASHLSVCDGCSKVRQDDNAWETLSAYLQQQTDLQYSHVLCGTCEKKYFGDMAGEANAG